MRINKKVMVTILISEKELNMMEDFCLCYNLCKKHNKVNDWEQLDKFQYSCPKCVKEQEKYKKVNWKVLCRLWNAYEKNISKQDK
jgi:hypothetical protein